MRVVNRMLYSDLILFLSGFDHDLVELTSTSCPSLVVSRDLPSDTLATIISASVVSRSRDLTACVP